MNKKSTIIRIADIARMAGVSTGTVDRVIHNRGRVSKENLQKVQAVLDEVNYKPNLLAQSLASKKQYTLAAVIPSFKEGQYWEAIDDGIDIASKELMQYNVTVNRFFFDQYDFNSFDQMMETVMKEEIDGFLIATLFTNSVIKYARQLSLQDIPYIFIDANIPAQGQLAYFGTESYDCGIIAARLLTERIDEMGDILVAKISNKTSNNSTQRINRSKGFFDYLKQTDFKGVIHQVELKLDEKTYNYEVLDELFHQHPNIQGLTIFNSASFLLGDYLKERECHGKVVVGYDLTKKNANLLADGTMTALIAQRPNEQGYFGIKALSNYLLFNQQPDEINLMPIDILIKENLKYYLENKLL